MRDLQKKYYFSMNDKSDLFLILKRVSKVLLAILLLKAIRLYLIKNEEANSVINELFTIASPEQIFRFVSINLMAVGVLGLIVAYLIQGKSIIKNKLFSFLFFFCLLDGAFMYLFPEIPLSISKAIFLDLD
ncbi:hypothetical protein PUS82_00050 [Cytobacillus firmus]|uniref:hypothetical protein n=1 Tax=Cytobacillus firmus TaxID=1399 RepID=UPI00237A130A|nr:hypothetical protein [Cytobacillus firmus]MDD9309724.1 hypothetical protein [Cytobacillus firmus]